MVKVALAEQLNEDKIQELGRLERRNRRLGELAIGSEQRLYNNDPLAHVFLRLEADKFVDIEAQVRAEYRGDMSERSEITSKEVENSDEKPFYTVFNYRLEGDDLVYTETGKSLNELLADGTTAAEADYETDQDSYGYHLDRAKVLASHGPAMVRWRKQNPQQAAMVASLCPSAKELAPQVAKLGNFKLHREMSSNWILEPTDEGIQVHVFSLDHLTLEGLQAIYDELGINVEVANTTLQEVQQIRQLNVTGGQAAKDKITSIHDAFLSRIYPYSAPYYQGVKHNHKQEQAYALVTAKPEAENMYVNAVESVAQSLMVGYIHPSLGKLLMELRSAYPSADKLPPALQLGGRLSLEQAREFMEYLHLQALPEYIFGDRKEHQKFRAQNNLASDSGGYSGVASAGSYASTNEISREGACPTSGGGLMAQSSAEHANSAMAVAMGLHSRKKEFESKWCPNCLPEPQHGQSVKAWRKADRIGCYDCGREEDVCTKNVVRRGRRVARDKNIAFGTLDIMTASWRQFGAQIRLDKWRRLRVASTERIEQEQLDQLIAQEETEIVQLKLVT